MSSRFLCEDILVWDVNKKLSYRKQIAHQLRTQYVVGIYSNSVTLKSTLGVTEGRWKHHHSKIMYDLLCDIEYYHDLEIWVWEVTQGDKVIETGTIRFRKRFHIRLL